MPCTKPVSSHLGQKLTRPLITYNNNNYEQLKTASSSKFGATKLLNAELNIEHNTIADKGIKKV